MYLKKTAYLLFVLLLPILAGCDKDTHSPGPQGGRGGSMARFAITGNSLYIVDDQSLRQYDISSPDNPIKKSDTYLGFGIETIYPYQKNLFIGARDGLYLFDNSPADGPVLKGKYWHIQSCDPVVVQDRYAYVTLRGGSDCRLGNMLSSLDVVDITDISNPKMIHTQTMTEPYGLGVSGKHLFVCEGGYGLKTYDIANPEAPRLVHTFSDIPAYDVIVRNENALLVTGANGLYQFSFSDEPGSLKPLSHIPVK